MFIQGKSLENLKPLFFSSWRRGIRLSPVQRSPDGIPATEGGCAATRARFSRWQSHQKKNLFFRLLVGFMCSFFVLANWALKGYSREVNIFLLLHYYQGGPTRHFILVFYNEIKEIQNTEKTGDCLVPACFWKREPPMTLEVHLH
jgi:hypothetical protein